MTGTWRLSHAGFLLWLEGLWGDVAQVAAGVSGKVAFGTPCRNKLFSGVLRLSGGDEPAETGL
jgi:hypothetical protein